MDKRVWACSGSGCGAKAWTGQSGLAGSRGVLTWGAAGYAVAALGAVEMSVAALARKLGVGWQIVWSAVRPLLR